MITSIVLFLSLIRSEPRPPTDPLPALPELNTCSEAISNMGMTVAFIGAGATGKGTAARMFNAIQFSVGDMLRLGIQAGKPDMLEAKVYLDGGKYIPSDMLNRLIATFFSGLPKDGLLILDGALRKFGELFSTEEKLHAAGRRIDIAFYFDVDQKLSTYRTLHRWTCPTCQRSYHAIDRPSRYIDVCEFCDYSFLGKRNDDTPEMARIRWDVFIQETGKVIFELAKRGILYSIDAARSPEEIYDEILAITNRHSQSPR